MRNPLIAALLVGTGAAAQQTIQLSAPALTEEDQYSPQLPSQYKCNACKGVTLKLEIATKKISKPRETLLVETYETTCKWTNFQGYGVSKINGKNVLTGPGIETEKDEGNGMGSIQMGGETWSRRLGSLCTEIVDEHGESEIYTLVKSGKSLCTTFCQNREKNEL